MASSEVIDMKAYSFPKQIVLANVAPAGCCPDPMFAHVMRRLAIEAFGGENENGAGVLDSVVDLCSRNNWMEVTNAQVFFAGQRVAVYSRDWVLRGYSTIAETPAPNGAWTSNRLRLSGPLPAGSTSGDLLVVEAPNA
jgi:hypothetical protein